VLIRTYPKIQSDNNNFQWIRKTTGKKEVFEKDNFGSNRTNLNILATKTMFQTLGQSLIII